ncbi:hypothetical protein A6770_14980 [Nostoc minutum NIES-26]|uniref:Uncharacterized protein n=1 Tax=Nostoc minutum NIES-26 TaxID=1844469 RepID=A0A367RK41_9NOSO|nr:hypothetical protein A6770_14980 [Nostoc minutum NIES-26]
MLNSLFKLVKKHPKTSASIFILLGLISLIQPKPQTQTQGQGQAQVGEHPEESFDSSKCKVYTAGILAGAIVHQFKSTSGSFAYVMFTDRVEVVRIFENKSLYLWKNRQDFQNTEYTELVQVLPPESVQELNRLMAIHSYVAMGTEAIARSASPTLFDSDRCSID